MAGVLFGEEKTVGRALSSSSSRAAVKPITAVVLSVYCGPTPSSCLVESTIYVWDKESQDLNSGFNEKKQVLQALCKKK